MISFKLKRKNNIDVKINKLLDLTNNFIFVEYYTHTNKKMYKIKNEYTKYSSEKYVLCGVDEGIEKAIDYAIEIITKEKNKYYNENNTQ